MSVTYKAILVGNSEFPEDPHGLPKLNGPVNDVRILKQALCNPEKGLFEEKNVTTLLNATSAEILTALEQFFKNLTHNDQSLFYYSGHGLQDRMSTLYLCAKNSKKDSPISTTIPASVINRLIENYAPRKHVLILDCCHSGGFKGGELSRKLQATGRFVMTSSSSMELTVDSDNPNSPSPFTKYLHEALLSDKINRNEEGYVSSDDVYDYISPLIYDETKQRPQKQAGGVGSLPLCKRKLIPKKKLEEINEEYKTINMGVGKPRLNVSQEKIYHIGVGFDETLHDETIDVFNEGSGKLDWTATCKSDWIEIKKHDTYIQLKFTPKAGMNRGSIHVKDKNGCGSKTIPVTIEKLKKPSPKLPEPEIANNTHKEKQEAHLLKDDFPTSPAKLLATFKDVKMRHINQAKAIVDNSEQSGTIKVLSNSIEFVGDIKITIKDIDVLDYYPQDINPGYTYNYMGISGHYDGVKKMMYFYCFSWFGAGQTWKMAEQIHNLIKNKRLSVDKNFKTHINTNQTNQSSAPNIQPPKKPTPPPQQNNIYMPGSWNIYIYQFGQQISYLNLYFNVGGALSGTQQSADGFSQIKGTWGYNPHNKLLTYNVMVYLMNGAIPDRGSVSLQVEPNGNISGTDLLGRRWTLQKTGN
ncbi:caspase family protein [Algibacter sp. 2305UL17-15]|uniref:caspase family protein n=1 Tax=Algibacter sp. 2305UL17-15 TaxID=3231268 RepID=UPI0034595459